MYRDPVQLDQIPQVSATGLKIFKNTVSLQANNVRLQPGACCSGTPYKWDPLDFSSSSRQAFLEAQFQDGIIFLKCCHTLNDLLPFFHRRIVFLRPAEEFVGSVSDVIFGDVIINVIRVTSEGDSQRSGLMWGSYLPRDAEKYFMNVDFLK